MTPVSNSRPTVSVVIPVRDDAAKLEVCLEALWLQTRRPDQIIVVDNASDDMTRTVASWWDTTYVYEAEEGIGAASSAGYDSATGDVIARLDADSVPPGDWVERVAAAFQQDHDLQAVTGPGVFDTLPGALSRVADALYMRPYFRIFGRVVGHAPVFGSNFAMTRQAWQHAREHVHRHDREVHDDLDLSFSLPAAGKFVIDGDLQVTVSARPFTDPVAFARRVRRGLHTVRVNRVARIPARHPSTRRPVREKSPTAATRDLA